MATDSLPAQSLGKFASRSAPGQSGAATSKVTALHKLALSHHARKNYVQAEALYKEALKILDCGPERQPEGQPEGQKDPEYAKVLNNLGHLYYSRRKYAEAETLYRRSLRLAEQQTGPYSAKVARRLVNLGKLYFVTGRREEAALHYQRAIAILERELGPTHEATAKAVETFAAMMKASAESA